jgi:iodotyrosine deiodinase
MTAPDFIPVGSFYREVPVDQSRRRAAGFLGLMGRRRSVRQFSGRPVPRDLIEDCIRAAGTAPSGANLQPWHFVAVSDPQVKRRIRLAAEREERRFYEERAPRQWLDALAPLGTGPEKPFLEIAPWLIAVFVKRHGAGPDPRAAKHYYAAESVGIAAGLLVAAVHHAGLASLVHTPAPMGFLNEVLGRPVSERPLLILVVGYPAEDAVVPDIRRKGLEEIATFV